MSFITDEICTEYTNHQHVICQTVTELCELCDGVANCEVVNKTDICSLLEVVCTYEDSFILLFIILIYFSSIIVYYTLAFSVSYFVRSMCQ